MPGGVFARRPHRPIAAFPQSDHQMRRNLRASADRTQTPLPDKVMLAILERIPGFETSRPRLGLVARWSSAPDALPSEPASRSPFR